MAKCHKYWLGLKSCILNKERSFCNHLLTTYRCKASGDVLCRWCRGSPSWLTTAVEIKVKVKVKVIHATSVVPEVSRLLPRSRLTHALCPQMDPVTSLHPDQWKTHWWTFQFIKTWQTQLTFRCSSEGNKGHVLIVFIKSWHKHVCFWRVLSVSHCCSSFLLPSLYIITHVFIVVLHNPDESSTGQSPPGLLIHQPSHSSVCGAFRQPPPLCPSRTIH